MQVTHSDESISSLLDVLAGLQHGRTVDEVARDLQISSDALTCWIRGLDILASLNRENGKMVESPEVRELRRLRMENEYLRQQRDLYRKACGIVSPPGRRGQV
jgi:transposase